MPNKYSFNVNKSFIIKSLGSNMEKRSRKAANNVISRKVSDIVPALHHEIRPVFRDTRKRSIRIFKNYIMCIDMAVDISITPINDSECPVKPLDLEKFKYIVRSSMLGYLNLTGGNKIA